MLRSERGASSILVIFMMIVLVVLGALAVTASYANLTLSRRTHDAYADMYMLDASAEAVLARVDACLEDAEDNARYYMEHGGYTLQVGGVLDSGAQSAVYNAYAVTAGNADARKAYLETLLKRLYCYFAMEALEPMVQAGEVELTLSDRYAGPGALLTPGSPIPEGGALTVTLTVSFGNEPGARQLSGALDVVCPQYVLTPEQGYASLERGEGASRFNLTSWRQWQVPFEYEEGYNFDSTLSDEGL